MAMMDESSDISDDERMIAELKQDMPAENEDYSMLVAVDHIPVIPPAKIEKLSQVLTKMFTKAGPIRGPLFIPVDDEGNTKGYCFIEYEEAKDAANAVEMYSGHRLDKQHTFEVFLVTDLDKLSHVTEEFVPPPEKDKKDEVDLQWWLLDGRGLDQYAVRADTSTCVNWNTKGEPEIVHERKNWTETYVVWSPRGSYLTTFHRKGIALWGGPNFTQVMRFPHPGVKLIDFSPCENYLVTWSNEVADDPRNPQTICVWDIRTGRRLRGFSSEEQILWPTFKWSFDDAYVARYSADCITIYQTPSMKMLQKKEIRIENMKGFSWCPSDNCLAYWVEEAKEQPARVVILDIPDRTERRVKNLFNVKECQLYWQNKGDYLCVRVGRPTKTKKSVFTSFEIFHMKERQIPVDNLEIKDQLDNFAWENDGDKFAIIHGETGKQCVSFYKMKQGNQGSRIEKLHTAERKSVNQLIWSPKGRYIVLAGLRSTQGILEFWDTVEMICLNQAEHFMATDVEWDPTGRYVTSCVSYWRHQMENGFKIWSFQGRPLYSVSIDKFYQLSWRPRPPTLLTEADIKRIKRNLKTYAARFDKEDQQSGSKASREQVERRNQQLADFQEFKKRALAEANARKAERMALRGGVESENEATLDDVETAELFFEEKVEEV